MKVLEIRVPCTLRKYNGTGTAAAKNGVARTVVFKLIQLKYQPTFFVTHFAFAMQVCDIAAVDKARTPICWAFLHMAEVCCFV